MSTRFRIQAKTLFLTYPQSGALTKEALLQFLLEKLQPIYIVVGSESHADGQPHLHAVAGFATRREWSGPDAFDFGGKHPNVQSARNAQAVLQYATKGADFCTYGDVPLRQRWADIAGLTAKDDFLSAVRSSYPRDFILSNSKLQEYAEQLGNSTAASYQTDSSRVWDLPPALTEWLPNLEVRSRAIARRRSATASRFKQSTDRVSVHVCITPAPLRQAALGLS